MVVCGVCGSECVEGNNIKCAGNCENSFHLNCIKNEAEGKITRSTRDWKCPSCKTKSNQSSVKSSSSTEGVLTKDFLIKVMEGFKKEVFSEMASFKTEVVSEMASFKTEMSELSTSVQFISDKLDASNLLMEDIKSKLSELQKENEGLKAKNEVLGREVADLRERMRSMEQYSRVKNIEISGLPVTQGENISDLVADVGAALGVEVQGADIAAAHRVPSFRSDREPALIVQFTSRIIKEQWMAKSRKKKNLTARDVNQHFPTKRVFINEHLSPENKKFLTKLKQKGRDLGYTFIWSRDGKFFVRKSEGEPVKRINTYEDMDRLK